MKFVLGTCWLSYFVWFCMLCIKNINYKKEITTTTVVLLFCFRICFCESSSTIWFWQMCNKVLTCCHLWKLQAVWPSHHLRVFQVLSLSAKQLIGSSGSPEANWLLWNSLVMWILKNCWTLAILLAYRMHVLGHFRCLQGDDRVGHFWFPKPVWLWC